MAVGGSDVIKDISENLLCCDVCQEPFESHSRPPKILSCFHTFCGVCLDKLIQSGKVKCPLCRQYTVVTDKIPTDPTRSALLDKIRAVHSQKGVVCEACDGGINSQYRCQDCEEFICVECFNAHRRIKQTRNHTVVSLTEAVQDPSKFVKSIEYCSRHPDMKLDLYCETCKLSVCTKCAFVVHKEGHQIKEVETVVEKNKEEVLTFCKELQQMVPTFQAKLEQSRASLQQGKDNMVAAEEKIKTAISHIINAAKKREAELLQKLRSRAKTDQLTLEEQVATFSSKLSAAQTTSGHGRRLVSMNLTTHILEQAQHIDKMTKDLKKDLKAPVEAAPTYEVKTRMMFGVEETVKKYVELADPLYIREVEKPSSVVHVQQNRPVQLPAFTWDAEHCGFASSVTYDLMTLTNKPPEHNYGRVPAFGFPFPGTCGSRGFTGSCYWQVIFKIVPSPSIEVSRNILQMGVCTEESRQQGRTENIAFNIAMELELAVANAGSKVLCLEGPVLPDTPYSRTFGFLVDASAGRLTSIDVKTQRVLSRTSVDTRQPLWLWADMPCCQTDLTAEVHLTIESGQSLAMTPSLVKLLRNILAT